VLFVADSNGHYVELREGQGGSTFSGPGQVKDRPELKGLRKVHGDLPDICREMHGVDNPRIVIEAKDRKSYQVVFNKGEESLKLIAKHLGLAVVLEERKIDAITLRVSRRGHRLKAAAKGKRVDLAREIGISRDEEGRWQFEGITADELARFLEADFRRPVVNLTSLKGRWSVTLSNEAVKNCPSADETTTLDDLGLELQWEKVKVPVTVIKDKSK
jgi:hypothetical protein